MPQDIETWKAIPGYGGLYEVSDQGRVRGLDRLSSSGCWLKGRILKPCLSGPGTSKYYSVTLRDGKGGGRPYKIHRLVLLAFVGPCPGPWIDACHANDIKTDNRLSNLRWDTRSENIKERYRNRGYVSPLPKLNFEEQRLQQELIVTLEEKRLEYLASHSDEEVWLPVPGFEGICEVSDRGRVRSVARDVIQSNGVVYKVHEQIRQLSPSKGGYMQVKIRANGKVRVILVHSLVMLAFVGPRPKGTVVCHNDGNRQNNDLDNLRYDTYKSNGADMIKHGNSLIGSRNSSAKLDEIKVKVILSQKGRKSQIKLSKEFGVSKSVISAIHRDKIWTHVNRS